MEDNRAVRTSGGGRGAFLVFDFDGVIADSEVLANSVLAEIVTELGAPTSLDDAMRLFQGKRVEDVVTIIRTRVGRPLPDGFLEFLHDRTLARFRDELCAVDGVADFIDTFGAYPRAIASSSSPDRLAACLDILELTTLFGSHVYSASNVARGKPHPDIFLHAARCLEADCADCIVIEDSAGGVRAAVAAGMTAIGLLAASHVGENHGRELSAAGAYAVARDYAELAALTHAILDGRSMMGSAR